MGDHFRDIKRKEERMDSVTYHCKKYFLTVTKTLKNVHTA